MDSTEAIIARHDEVLKQHSKDIQEHDKALNEHNTIAAKHTEILKQHDKEMWELKDQSALMYKIATSVELLAKESSVTNENLNKLDTKIDKVDGKVENVDTKVEEMDDAMRCIQNEPYKKDADKYRTAIKYIVTAILGAVTTLALKNIGLI